MNIDSAYPSEFLKSSDLERPMTATMDYVKIMTVGDEDKPVLFFKGEKRGLVLNKTNKEMIKSVFGPNTDNWAGGSIILYETMVPFRDTQVSAIRVKHPKSGVVPGNIMTRDRKSPDYKGRAEPADEHNLRQAPNNKFRAEPADEDDIPF